MERDALDLGTEHVGRLFRKFFVPTLLGMLSISAVTVADGIFVGHGVGSDGIAAINICIPLLMLFTGFGLMVGAGCSVVASIHLARQQIKAARINVTQALLFGTLVTLVCSALILGFVRPVAAWLGSSEHLLPMVVDYLWGFVPALVPQMWVAVGLFVVRLDGVPRLAMWCSVVSALVNVVLDWFFVFPLGWGVFGAALASTLAVAIGGTIVGAYLFRRARTLRFYPLKASRKSLRLTLRNIGYQCRIGASAMLGEATMAVLIMSNIVISLVKNIIPDKVRIPAFIVIIASFVTIIEMLMKAYVPALYASLGVFIPLIVVNCIILGRAEAFASKNLAFDSMLDGVGIGLGFTLSLTVIGSVREMLGNGSIFGWSFGISDYTPLIFVLAPGAFLVLGYLMVLFNKLAKR